MLRTSRAMQKHPRRALYSVVSKAYASAMACPFSGGKPPQQQLDPRKDTDLKPYSDIPKFGMWRLLRNGAKSPYHLWEDLQDEKLYRMWLPGFGSCLAVTDPVEYMKVLRAEGPYPHGAIMNQWPTDKAMQRLDHPNKGLYTAGPEWKRLRNHLQHALLTPGAVKGYTAGMCQAAELASQDFSRQVQKEKLEDYFGRFSFDMFCSVAFGQQMRTTSAASALPENREFCEQISLMVDLLSDMMRSPYQDAMNKMGVLTAKYKEYEKLIADVMDRPTRIIEEFLKRREAGELTEEEKNSYIAHNLANFEKRGDQLNVEETVGLIMFLLGASIDNTSGILRWNLLNLALKPEIQEKVREELRSNGIVPGPDSDKRMTEVFKSGKSALPYLNAVIRETYRVRPAAPVHIIRKVDTEIELDGHSVPAGTPMLFCSYSAQMDADNVPDWDQFRPERWLPEEVQARKGTSAEVIDHTLMRDNFSKGARMCPAARVASQEIQIMLATLIRDWDISIAPGQNLNTIWDVTAVQSLVIRPEMPKLVVKPIRQ